MKYLQNTLLACSALSALCFTGCGGEGDSAPEASAPEAAAQVTLPDAPDAAIHTIIQEMVSGNGGILWQAMPESYRADVNSLAQLAGTKVDAEIYDQSFALVGRLAEVADKQKEFIFNTELGGTQDPEEIAKLKEAWPSIIGLVETITNSSIASTSALQSFDGQKFCDETISSVIEFSEDFSALAGDELPLEAYRDVVVKALESSDSTAMLEMTSPDGTVNSEEFSKVEGRWVPTELATDWAEQIAEATTQLEAMSPEQVAQNKPQIMGAITMLEGVLTQIETAETQEAFDQALQGAMMPLMGIMMMQQNLGGGQPGAPAMPAMPVAP